MKIDPYGIGIENHTITLEEGTINRTQTLKKPSKMMTHPTMADRFPHFSHSSPEIPNTCHQNSHFTNNTYQAAQTTGHAHHTAPFRMTNISHDQQGFHHRGSSKLDSSLYGTFPHEDYNHCLHNSNIATNHPEGIPFGQARGTIYEGSLLSSGMISKPSNREHIFNRKF